MDNLYKVFILIFLFYLSQSESMYTRVNFCAGKNGIYKDPESCAAYYRCYMLNGIRYLCPGYLHFNFELKKCEEPEKAGCLLTKPKPSNPSNNNTDSCGQFKSIDKCLEDEKCDICLTSKRPKCESKENVGNCSESLSNWDEKENPDPIELVPDESDPSPENTVYLKSSEKMPINLKLTSEEKSIKVKKYLQYLKKILARRNAANYNEEDQGDFITFDEYEDDEVVNTSKMNEGDDDKPMVFKLVGVKDLLKRVTFSINPKEKECSKNSGKYECDFEVELKPSKCKKTKKLMQEYKIKFKLLPITTNNNTTSKTTPTTPSTIASTAASPKPKPTNRYESLYFKGRGLKRSQGFYILNIKHLCPENFGKI